MERIIPNSYAGLSAELSERIARSATDLATAGRKARPTKTLDDRLRMLLLIRQAAPLFEPVDVRLVRTYLTLFDRSDHV